MNNASNVTTGKPKIGGATYRAEKGTSLPTSVEAVLDNAFLPLGYFGEEGLTNSNSPESDTKKAWGGDTVLNLSTGKSDTFNFTMIEALNVNVLKTVYGDDNVTGTLEAGITIKANADDTNEYSWVFDMVMKGDTLKRIVVPSASITELGDIVYSDEEAVAYPVTITAVPDAEGSTHYEYIKRSAVSGTE